MVQSIRSAQDTIDFSTYIYWAGGETIAAFGEALVERACAGVEVSGVAALIGADTLAGFAADTIATFAANLEALLARVPRVPRVARVPRPV